MRIPFIFQGLVLLSVSGFSLGLANATATYTDLDPKDAYADAIAALTDQGVVSGYEDGSFAEDQLVTRAEALKMILNASGLKLEEVTDLPYADVDPTAWYASSVQTGLSHDILTVNSDATFRPKDPVNLVEALKILILATDKKSALPSINSDTWYTAYLAYAIEHALIAPEADGTTPPDTLLTRGELCELLYRFQNEPYTGQVEYGIASYYGYSMNGHNTASGEALNAYGFQAAHKTLPFGTKIRITNVKTNASVIVEVVDRGPYTPGYIVDLTPAAFEQLGKLSTGLLKVRLEVLK